NANIVTARLPCQIRMIRAHGAEFVNLELSILHSGAGLHVKERAGRLKTLRQPHDDRANGEDNQHDRNADGQIEHTFKKAVERILERLFPQRDEAESVVLELCHGMAQSFLQIADDEEANA